MIKRADFPNDLADLQKSADEKFRVPTLHRFDMFRMGAPCLERVLRRKAEHSQFLPVIRFERFDGQETRQLADDAIHAFSEPVMVVDSRIMTQFQISNNDYVVDHLVQTLRVAPVDSSKSKPSSSLRRGLIWWLRGICSMNGIDEKPTTTRWHVAES